VPIAVGTEEVRQHAAGLGAVTEHPPWRASGGVSCSGHHAPRL
jgi:hypothetical protein